MKRMRSALCAFALLIVANAASAQDALVVGAHLDRNEDGTGGGASILWIHPRGNDTFVAGASLLSLPGTRWAFVTLGDMRKVNTLTTLNAEANLGAGSDDRGRFQYILLRGGITRELLAKRLWGEAEWLQADVARQQDGILRIGGTWVPATPLTLRASLYESLFGDSDTSLATMRADYDFGRVTAIAGTTAGTAIPALLQQAGTSSSRVRDIFAGVAFDAAARRWTVIASTLSVAGERSHRLSVSYRFATSGPLPVARGQ
jgi:hypothetical protein